MHVLDRVAERYPIVDARRLACRSVRTDPIDYGTSCVELKRVADRAAECRLARAITSVGRASPGATTTTSCPCPYTEEAPRAHDRARPRSSRTFSNGRWCWRIRRRTSSLRRALPCAKRSSSRDWPEEADCALLLDVNNVYVSSRNHGFDPERLPRRDSDTIASCRSTWQGTPTTARTASTHTIGPVIDPVWELYAEVLGRAGSRATMVEWDQNIPRVRRRVGRGSEGRAVPSACVAGRSGGRSPACLTPSSPRCNAGCRPW